MASNIQYSDLKLKFAENGGYVICYQTKTPRPARPGATYDDMSYDWKYPEEAFGPDDGDLAMARGRELQEMILAQNGVESPYKKAAGKAKAVPADPDAEMEDEEV